MKGASRKTASVAGQDQASELPAGERSRAPDWAAIERSAEFERLVRERRRVVIPALTAFALWFGAFVVLSAWAHDLMASEIVTGFSVAYAAALSLIVMTWLLAFIYIRASRRRVDPLAESVRQLVDGGSRAPADDQVAP